MNQEAISLTTYDDSPPLTLNPDDVSFIVEHLKSRVDIRREISGDRFILNPGAYVGIVRLPSGALISSSPRLPTQNIFRMLAVAHGLPEFRLPDTIDLAALDQMIEFVADYFADRLEERIEQGLYRSYVETEENLAVVRGRIQVADDVRHNYVLRNRTYCRFTELTWDVPENQVLRYVARRLSGWPFSRGLRSRLQQLERRMDEVSRVPFRPEDLDQLVYTRLNAGYEPLHRLCRLLLQDMSLAEEEGYNEFVSFLLDMNLLFEDFIGQVFASAVPPSFAQVVLQRTAALGYQHRSDGAIRPWGAIRPDLELRQGSRVLSVLDMKYKKTTGESIKNPDFYQVLSYCEAEGTKLGGLIYPRSEFTADDEIAIRNSDIRIHRFAINLAVPNAELIPEAERLVRRVRDWVLLGDELSASA